MKGRQQYSSSKKNVTINEIGFYLAKGVTLHPQLLVDFLNMLVECEYKSKVCILPATRLQMYSVKIKTRILSKYKSA